MKFYQNSHIPLEILIVLFSLTNTISGRRFPEDSYDTGDFFDYRYTWIKTALANLKDAPEIVNEWPSPSIKLGQVSGVAIDNSGQLLVFHRATNVWDANTFSERNIYQAIGEPAIPLPTILVLNETGELVDAWGENLFYMPHGITVDNENNVWVTDVALHQVFKFTPQQRQKPALILGEKFVPRDDDSHFCKPSAVAVMSTGDFFVADGYCNSRIIKYSPQGEKILQWGRRSGDSPFTLLVPHALALAERRGAVCVADREHGRVACYRADNGTFLAHYRNPLLGGRIFSVAYSHSNGGRLYLVNGPGTKVPVRGYVIDYTSGQLLQTFAPEGDFSNPHDVAVSPDGSTVYVAELNPYKVYKFYDSTAVDNSTEDSVKLAPVKPTATVEASSPTISFSAMDSEGGWGETAGAAGAAAGAGGAALLVLGALALLRARNRGKRGDSNPLLDTALTSHSLLRDHDDEHIKASTY